MPPKRRTETDLVREILLWCSYEPRVAWAARVNTGAHAIGEGKRRRFVRYGFVGCSDIIGQMVDGRFLAIEVKMGRNKPTQDQRAFLGNVDRHNGIAILAYSIDDVVDGIEQF